MTQKSQTEKFAELIKVNLSPKQADTLIPRVEAAIVTSKQKLNDELLPPFREIEGRYMELKTQIDFLQKGIDDDTQLLEVLLRGRNNRKGEVKVIRSASHISDRRSKEARANNIKWNYEFKIILETENRMMTYEELVAAFKKRYPSLDITQRKINQQFGNMNAGVKETIDRVKKGKRNIRGTDFLVYENHWGKLDWFDVTNINKPVPKAAYMKPFMFAHGRTA
jgi:hypothetical protein